MNLLYNLIYNLHIFYLFSLIIVSSLFLKDVVFSIIPKENFINISLQRNGPTSPFNNCKLYNILYPNIIVFFLKLIAPKKESEDFIYLYLSFYHPFFKNYYVIFNPNFFPFLNKLKFVGLEYICLCKDN